MKQKTFSRTHKFFIFPVIVISVLTLLSTRLIHLQVIQGYYLREVSEQNRVFAKKILANRGIFLDRFSKPLVYNKPEYFLLSDPKQLYSQRESIDEAEAMEWSATSSASIFRESYREYLYPEALSQVIGYVGQVSREDLENNSQLHMQQVIGKTGLEAVYERQLAGIDGVKEYEVNARGELLREVSEKPARSGENITLSLDPELTQFAYQLIKDKKASVLIGDSETGEILSLISTPTYNPNLFTVPVDGEAQRAERKKQVSAYFSNPDKLFFNRSLAGGYPPGSVFKPITALAGLDAQAFDKDSTVLDEGILKVGEFEYRNWYFRQFGRSEGQISLVRALARSNDIYFYKAAELIGPERLAKTSRMFGFGSPTGIELPAEASGVVPDPEWKERVIGEKWYLGNTYHFGIGQGDLLVTPVQVFQSIGVFANNGMSCKPTLLHTTQHSCKEFGFSQDNIDTVVEGLTQACSVGGTGFPFFEWNSQKEYKVSCKTGTAEFGESDENGNRRTHGWFIAFVDFSSIVGQDTENTEYPSKISVVVLIESDDQMKFKEGSKDAAPVAFEIFNWIEENRF